MDGSSVCEYGFWGGTVAGDRPNLLRLRSLSRIRQAGLDTHLIGELSGS